MVEMRQVHRTSTRIVGPLRQLCTTVLLANRMHVTTLLIVLVFGAMAQAQTFTTLYNFSNGSDGGFPAGA